MAASREIFDALPRGIGRIEGIRGAGHFPWKDVPDRYWPLLIDFVATASVPRAASRPSAVG